ncbi:hypothetical protein VTN77DRAFT_8574 [Rasamsonia byssochlamydoides]|uniref:uncharacterized protein n=1 Tax=Rasamsonia byssochlamydoides TaxID=89139 RepID=UPI0037421FC5
MNESSDDPPPIDRTGIWDRTNAALNFRWFGTRRHSERQRDRTILPTTSLSATRSDGLHPQTGAPSTGARQMPTAQQSSGDRIEHVSISLSPAESIPVDSHDREKAPTIGPEDKHNVFLRVFITAKMIVCSSWVNWLLFFVPAGIALGALHRSMGDESPISPTVIFAINAVAIIPLASMLGYATECVASNMGDTIGALLNVTFGNAVELIIFIALVADEVAIVQASLLGSILANLLLILGMCFLFGGLRFREQLYNSAITQMSACLLSLSVISLLLPTAFHASFSTIKTADAAVVKVSRGTSVVLLLVYILYLLFQLKSHAYIYESTPQHMIDEESHPGVLAEMLHSSPSSDTSSDSDSDASSGSNTTVKRIRNALRKKRRRKSSSASKETNSVPSLPSFVRTASTGSHAVDTPSVNDASGTLPGNGANGLEANQAGHAIAPEKPSAEVSNPSPEVTSRDFETTQTKKAARESIQKAKSKSHSRRKHRRDQKARENTDESDEEALPWTAPVRASDRSSPREGLMNDIALSSGDTQRRSFNIRNLPYKPTLPRVLTSSMLSPSAQPAQLDMPSAVSGVKPQRSHLRRTSSLPDRLNATLIATSIPSAQPLPHLVSKKRVEIKEIEDKPRLSRVSAVILLLVTTGLVAVCAEFLVDSIDYLVDTTGISQAFIGLIILPIVGNAAEHVTAVTVASKNKMDLAIGVALGSSIQIALFVTPVIVLLGWCLNTEMSLYFSLFETISLFASAFIVNYLMLDGRSNYLEGALLIAAYIIIAVAAFFYPSCENTSTANGGPSDASCR